MLNDWKRSPEKLRATVPLGAGLRIRFDDRFSRRRIWRAASKSEFGALDVLVHCAGAFTTGKIEATPVGQLDALYRANLRLPFALTQALLPLLKLRPGQIVFINSSQGLAARAATGPFRRNPTRTQGPRR